MSNYSNIEEEKAQNTEIIKPFDPKEIKFETKLLTIDSILKRLKSIPPAINLHPEFQRKEVWNKTKQSRLIESLLLRFPLPAFYFDGSNEDEWEVIDGLQRISTIRDFVLLEKFELQNLEYLTKFEKSGFKDLPPTFQRRIEEAQITAFIIEAGTPSEVKFNIFKRINTWGEPLTPQEIRHALNQGAPANLVEELANLEWFKKATGGINPKRMLDRDFVTRFIAFYLFSYETYQPDLDTFLNKGMAKIKELNELEILNLKTDFEAALETSYQIFGKHTFRKFHEIEDNRKPINKALFEIWTVTLAKLTVDERKLILNNKDQIIENFTKNIKDNVLFFKAISIGTGDKRQVERRFSAIQNLVNKIIQNDKKHTDKKLQIH